jgi:hypothetical protein
MKESLHIACNTVLTTIAISVTAAQLQAIQAHANTNLIQHSPQLVQQLFIPMEQ